MQNPRVAAGKIRLLVLLDINTCKARIVQLNQGSSLFSLPFQYRTKANVLQIDSNYAEFRVYRIPKTYLKFIIAPTVELRGTLTSRVNNQTWVTGQTSTNWLSLALYYGFPGVLWAYISATILTRQSGMALQVFLMVVMLVFVFGVTRFRMNWRKRQLVNILTQTFAGDLHGTSTQD